MQKLFDKIVLLGLCLLTMSFAEVDWVIITFMLLAIAISALCGYLESNTNVFLCVGYIILCLFLPWLLLFLPLIVYDCSSLKLTISKNDTNVSNLFKWLLRFCWVLALPAVFAGNVPQVAVSIVLSSAVAFLLQYRTNMQISTSNELLDLRDDTRERAEQLERTNRNLAENQENEVRLATLAERNRIAREIHDNVGHMLTRSLLQISALRVTHPDDDSLTNDLDMIKNTLSDAMDSIRNSVHNLHDESIDLKSRLETIIREFVFCPVKLKYDAEDLPTNIKLCFIAIVREALSNIAKHSNAISATVTLMEHPSFYQLVIADTGNKFAKKTGSGMSSVKSDTSHGIGLQSMSERITALGGIFRTEQNKGFTVFISVPKGEA